MNNLLSLFVLLPLFAAIVIVFLGAPSRLRRLFSLLVQLLVVGLAAFLLREVRQTGPLVLAVGNWAPPFGITLAADTLSALFLLTSQLVVFFVLLQECLVRSHHAEPRPLFPLLHFLSMGASLAFLTGDFFNLFVAFEVLLLSSYGLLSLEPTTGRTREAYPYLLLNVFGSSIFLVAAGFAYASYGTLNFVDLAVSIGESTDEPRKRLFGILCLAIFGLKAGLAPLHFWLPRAYAVLRPTLAAVFAAILTKVGVYVLLRLGATVADFSTLGLDRLLVFGGGITLVFGGFGALSRTSIRGILSFHIISQIGYMMLGLGLGGPLALVGVLLFALHNMIVKPGLFLVGGVVDHAFGGDEISKVGRVYALSPLLSLLFLVLAFSLSGFPPLTGFWSKYLLASGALALERLPEFGFILLGGLLTLLSMIKIWNGVFWDPAHVEPRSRIARRTLLVPALMAALTILLGLGLGDFTGLAETAIEQAQNRDEWRLRSESVGEKGR